MILKNHIAEGIDPKRKVLYRNFHSIDGKIYLIEISRNALKVFMLLFPNFEAYTRVPKQSCNAILFLTIRTPEASLTIAVNAKHLFCNKSTGSESVLKKT